MLRSAPPSFFLRLPSANLTFNTVKQRKAKRMGGRLTGMSESIEQKDNVLRAAVEKCCRLGQAYLDGDSDSVTELVEDISKALNAGDTAIWESLYGCVITGVPGENFLIELYVSSSNDPLFGRRLPDIWRLARDGNSKALSIAAAILAGVGGTGDQRLAAKRAVYAAATNDAHRRDVVRILVEAYRQYSDKGALLAALGGAAKGGTDSALASAVLSCLRDGLARGLSHSGARYLATSAFAGYLMVPQLWTAADVIIIVKFLSADVLPQLKPIVGQLSNEARAAFTDSLESTLFDRSLASEPRRTALLALKLFCAEATAGQIEQILCAASTSTELCRDFADYFVSVASQTQSSSVGNAAFGALLDMSRATIDARTAKVFDRYLAEITDAQFLDAKIRSYIGAENLEAAHLLLQRKCEVLSQQAQQRQEREEQQKRQDQQKQQTERDEQEQQKQRDQKQDELIESLLQLADTCSKIGKLAQARKARRAVLLSWENSTLLTARERLDNFAKMARDCYAANDAPEAERICNKALESVDANANADLAQDAIVPCLKLLHEIVARQGRTREAGQLQRRIARLEGQEEKPDELEGVMRTYVGLPAIIDLSLRPDGLSLETDDFPRLIKESSGLDLKKYFLDAFADAEFLSANQKRKFSQDLFRIFQTVTAFCSEPDHVTMHRAEVTEVVVPDALSQGWVQKMTIDTKVCFRLVPNPPYEASFSHVSGISFHVGGKIIALSDLTLRALDNKCIITPTLNEMSQLPAAGHPIDVLMNAGKDLLVGVMMKIGKISTELPIVMDDFRHYLADAMRFKALLHDHDKDLVAFFERTANITLADPITRSLLIRGFRLIKNNDTIEIERMQPSKCDLGGIALAIAEKVKLKVARVSHEMRIEKLSGVGIEIPFDPPTELIAIGLDLKRSLPNTITSLSMSGPDGEDRRRMIVGTAPGCWVGVDLGQNMQPSLDANGNWMVFGVTHNPISGAPQKFFMRLDRSNNIKMTTREIADLVTQTAIEGFDPADPTTWKWGAVAIGGQTLLTAGSVTRKQARNLGRLIGWIMKGGSSPDPGDDDESPK